MRSWWVALGLVVASAAACSKPSRVFVDRVNVESFSGGDVVGLKEAQLTQRLRRQLEVAHFTVLENEQQPADGVAPWRVTVAIDIGEPDPQQAPSGVVQGAISVSRRGGAESFEAQRVERKPSASNRVEDIQDAAMTALDFVLARLTTESHALIELGSQPDAVVVEKLTKGDDATKSAAVTILAQRRNAAALPWLLERLKTDELSAIRHTMGLLVELKDPRAVPALIDASRSRNNIVQREVAFALGAIGGEEAEAYLWSLSQGHDDELVRESAKRALEELKSHQKEPSGGTP